MNEFGEFLIGARPEVPWKSEWRREFERRSAEEAAARRMAAVSAKPSPVKRRPVAADPLQRKRRTRATLETNPVCPVAGCGRRTRMAGGACWQCERKARLEAKRRYCARGCGRQLYRAGDICSACSRLPQHLPHQRRVCAAGCGRLLRRDAIRDVCKPCFRAGQAENPAAHPVACALGCGERTRNADRVCWRCVKRPRPRAALERTAKKNQAAQVRQQERQAA